MGSRATGFAYLSGGFIEFAAVWDDADDTKHIAAVNVDDIVALVRQDETQTHLELSSGRVLHVRGDYYQIVGLCSQQRARG